MNTTRAVSGVWAPDEERHQRHAANSFDDVGYFHRAVTSPAERLGAPRTQTSSWGSSRELCGKLRRSRQPGEEGTEGRLRAATSPSAPLRPPLLAPVAQGRAATPPPPPLPTLVRPNAYAAAQDRTTEGESWGGVRRPDRFPEGLGEALRDLVRQGRTRNGAVGGALPPAQHGRGPGPLSSTGGLRGQA